MSDNQQTCSVCYSPVTFLDNVMASGLSFSEALNFKSVCFWFTSGLSVSVVLESIILN